MSALAGQSIAMIRRPDDQGVFIQPQLSYFINDHPACRVQHGNVRIAVGQNILPLLPWNWIWINDIFPVADRLVRFFLQRIGLVMEIVVKIRILRDLFRIVHVQKFLCREKGLVGSPEIYPQGEGMVVFFSCQLLQLFAGQICQEKGFMRLLRRHRHTDGMLPAPEVFALIQRAFFQLREIVLFLKVNLRKHPLNPVLRPRQPALFQIIIIFFCIVRIAVTCL